MLKNENPSWSFSSICPDDERRKGHVVKLHRMPTYCSLFCVLCDSRCLMFINIHQLDVLHKDISWIFIVWTARLYYVLKCPEQYADMHSIANFTQTRQYHVNHDCDVDQIFIEWYAAYAPWKWKRGCILPSLGGEALRQRISTTAPRPRDPKRHALPIELRIFSEGGLSERVHQKVCNILQRLTSTWIGYAQMIGHISLAHKVATLFAVSACRSTAVVYSTDTDI